MLFACSLGFFMSLFLFHLMDSLPRFRMLALRLHSYGHMDAHESRAGFDDFILFTQDSPVALFYFISLTCHDTDGVYRITFYFTKHDLFTSLWESTSSCYPGENWFWAARRKWRTGRLRSRHCTACNVQARLWFWWHGIGLPLSRAFFTGQRTEFRGPRILEYGSAARNTENLRDRGRLIGWSGCFIPSTNHRGSTDICHTKHQNQKQKRAGRGIQALRDIDTYCRWQHICFEKAQKERVEELWLYVSLRKTFHYLARGGNASFGGGNFHHTQASFIHTGLQLPRPESVNTEVFASLQSLPSCRPSA